jgi:hypothetical protein
MGDRECVLRLLSFLQIPYQEYKSKNLDAFLNQCMMGLNRETETNLQVLANRFKRTMVDCYRLFGDEAFRKLKRGSARRSPINRALFEVWAAIIESLSASDVDCLEAKKEELRRRFLTLLEDSDLEAAITYGTGDPRKVRLRFSKIEEIVREALQ